MTIMTMAAPDPERATAAARAAYPNGSLSPPAPPPANAIASTSTSTGPARPAGPASAPMLATYVPRGQQSDRDLYWMKHALEMAQEAFDAAEVPVGCVFVYEGGQGEDDEREGGSRTGAEGEGKGWGKVISSKRNRTNELMNATRHAELEAIDEILTLFPPRSTSFALNPHNSSSSLDDVNPFAKTTLYVTVEPCIMCASALRQIGIKRVVFGAGNERFGGNGSVLPIHEDPALVFSPPYESVGGYMREEAIMILRRFYLTENTNAPNPKSKARRVLKTDIQPPGVSMHGPGGQQTSKKR